MKLMLMFCISFTIILKSQTYSWNTLPDSPLAGRHDDIHFLTPELGWAVNSQGQIVKTSDGGNTWIIQLQTESYFRSIKFADSLNGWAGTLNYPNLLYHTSNGGNTWDLVSNLPELKPQGVCGLSISGNTIYGTGVYYGPAVIIKSTDMGTTWQSINMSNYASTLIDCYFISPDSGFVVGGSPNTTFGTHGTVRATVLFTSDGGSSWVTRYWETTSPEWGWKIVFPTKTTGYVSVENFNSASILRTTDSGVTWLKLPVPGFSDLEGIGFINADTGWVAARDAEAYTTNGGTTWTTKGIDIGTQINRFQFFGDTLAYAAGERIYKYSKTVTTHVVDNNSETKSFLLSGNYPNPFNPFTTIEYNLPEPSTVFIRIYDGLGKEILTLTNSFMEPGKHSITWDGKDSNGNTLSSGPYIYRIDAGKYAESRMMMMLK